VVFRRFSAAPLTGDEKTGSCEIGQRSLGAFQAQHQIARMKVNQQGPSPFSRRRLLYNRPSDFRQELCPLPSGILAETGTTPGGAVPCRTDICGRSVS
jgi:hypothetical protein